MKQALLLVALMATDNFLCAQMPNSAPFDTLLIERFEADPTLNMLNIPTGFDQQWVNYDHDGFPGLCVKNNPTPDAWYWEKDFSSDISAENSCYTSCSWFNNDPQEDFQAANWLILPPVLIPDSFCILQWKSLSYQGPSFLDGYQLLVSVGTNDVFSNVFKDTLFTAASMESCPNAVDCGSLNVSQYNFSPGYIHANGFTNPAYYFYFPPIAAYRGKLEPHTVSLARYAGKTIYIAFLHDSNNDNLLQVDDILVVDQKTSATDNLSGITSHFVITPNPSTTTVRVEWTLFEPSATELEVRDIAGHLVHTVYFPEQSAHQYEMNIQAWPSGIYIISLLYKNGIATRRFVKI